MIRRAVLGGQADESGIVGEFAVAAVPLVSSRREGGLQHTISWVRRQYGWSAGWRTAVSARDVVLVDPPAWVSTAISFRRLRAGLSAPIVVAQAEEVAAAFRSMDGRASSG